MVSIIVPIYNASKYLDDCLQSILMQNFSNFEVLCIDDGSKDDSAKIVEQYVIKDNRIKLYKQHNSGVSVARNYGLSVARGEYICFVDADDIVASDYLNTLHILSENNSFPICSFTRNINNLNKPQSSLLKFSSKVLINQVLDETIEHPNLWAMMFKSEIIKTYNLSFYPGCVRNEDTEFYIKYLVYERRNVVLTDYVGYFYRDNPSSAMHVTKKNAFTSFDASIRIYEFLTSHGIFMDYNKLLYCSIQAYSVRLARENNSELFIELHRLFNVRQVMYTLLSHSRISRRLVAMLYILLGKSLYYKFFSLTNW